MNLRTRIQWAWDGWTGKALNSFMNERTRRIKAEAEAGDIYSLKRDLQFARAAIADLKSQVPADYEAHRERRSDRLSDKAFSDMAANPRKYVDIPEDQEVILPPILKEK